MKNLSNARCYARLLCDCSDKLSREHYVSASVLELLGHWEAKRGEKLYRNEDAQRAIKFLLGLQEKDGSWWDYPLYNYHQQYGTAFALMSLKRCVR